MYDKLNSLVIPENKEYKNYDEAINKINEELILCIKKPYYTYYENIDIK